MSFATIEEEAVSGGGHTSVFWVVRRCQGVPNGIVWLWHHGSFQAGVSLRLQPWQSSSQPTSAHPIGHLADPCG